jgi:ABC-type dipeptide/oligopeptide/nickel transport system permease component
MAYEHGDTTRYILPIAALVMEPISKITRLVRAELVDQFQSEYILLCRAKGMKRNQIIWKHNLRQIFVVLLPEISIIFLYTLLNSFFIEDVYDIDGIARLFMSSIITGDSDVGIQYVMVDVNLITVISMYVFTFTTVMILITDLLMGVIDPRIKVYGKKYN